MQAKKKKKREGVKKTISSGHVRNILGFFLTFSDMHIKKTEWS